MYIQPPDLMSLQGTKIIGHILKHPNKVHENKCLKVYPDKIAHLPIIELNVKYSVSVFFAKDDKQAPMLESAPPKTRVVRYPRALHKVEANGPKIHIQHV